MFAQSSPSCSGWFIWLSLLVPRTIGAANDQAISQKIDQLVEEGYREHRIEPNPPSSEEVFLRRIYLDIIGRIPTHDEATDFLAAEAPNKRALLIQHLLDSEGHVSHSFNYWADVLRVKSDLRDEAGDAYAAWLKQAIRENRPYDELVTDLITAEGYVWDNPAVAYYIRDSGMPLDNMSNTTQIFLGTQLVCAQCHNHPFDEWSQLDYYKMAAYTYGVETRINVDRVVGLDEFQARKERRRSYEGMDRHLREAVDDILEPLSYGVREGERSLRLPADYQYDDAEANQTVHPDTIFGDRVSNTKGMREAYAEWMVSPTNERFTKVIANRLWKRAMGVGLIEPVDNLKDETEASNPALMEYLESQMVAFDYDMRRFLSVIYQTRTYQREATLVDADISDYHFPGPVLRRMTAEQLWDSMLTVTIPEVDERKGSSNYQQRIAAMKKKADYLLALSAEDILAQAERIATIEREFDGIATKLRADLAKARESGNKTLADTLSEQLRNGERSKQEALDRVNDSIAQQYKDTPMKESTDPAMMEKAASSERPETEMTSEEKWKDLPNDWVRASELRSPAPAGHFLRQFGQSDRETIENASTQPSVDQVLTLLNGDIYDQLISEDSMLMKRVDSIEGDTEKQDYIFMSLLSRRAKDHERALLSKSTQGKSAHEVAQSLVWALVNTREFAFVQ